MGTKKWEVWYIVDSRTGKRCSMGSFRTEKAAWDQITEWKVRNSRGFRLDVGDTVDHMEVRRMTGGK